MSSFKKSVVLRFAPSPTGRLHLGHALSALIAHDAAQHRGARFLLRIEDTDTTRCRAQYEAAIYHDLAWLGVGWEKPVRRQSDHLQDYLAAADRLSSLGLLYPCTCSRKQIAAAMAGKEAAGNTWPRDPDGSPLYPGTCRPEIPAPVDIGAVASGEHALRLDMKRAIAHAGDRLDWIEYGARFYEAGFEADGICDAIAADPAAWGDIVLCRKETSTSYHLAVVVDDAVQGITHVTRGRDLFEATAIHRLLQRLLDLPEPRYAHHRLLLGRDGRKLSKSANDTSLQALRNGGAIPNEIRRLVGLAAVPSEAEQPEPDREGND